MVWPVNGYNSTWLVANKCHHQSLFGLQHNDSSLFSVCYIMTMTIYRSAWMAKNSKMNVMCELVLVGLHASHRMTHLQLLLSGVANSSTSNLLQVLSDRSEVWFGWLMMVFHSM